MILQALVDLARREGLVDEPDFEPKPVRWVINIGADGRFLEVLETEGPADARGKIRPRVMQVPRAPVRTSGSAACFLVDKAEYVLGYDPDDKPNKRSKLGHHRELFTQFIEGVLALVPDEPGLTAVLGFLRNPLALSECIARIRDRVAANDLFAFRFDVVNDLESGWPVHDRERVREAWKQLRQPSDTGDAAKADCLVCGRNAIPIRVHPQVKRVPGGTPSGIALVSFNAPAFESLGLEGNDNAPVCTQCAEAYGTALNRLFHPQYTAPGGDFLGRRSFRLSDDTAVLYWAAQPDPIEGEFSLLDDDSADPIRVEALYESIRRGQQTTLDDAANFYALVVTGGQGRATLRGYHQTTVGEAKGNIKQYFDDIEIVRRFSTSRRWPSLNRLVRSLATQGKFENVDPGLAGLLFLAVLSGGLFPAAVLQAAIRRIHSEPENPGRGQFKHTQERLALVRATLNRQFRSPQDYSIKTLITQEIPPVLDPNCTNNAYCLGRLFAVLERLQSSAIGNPSATITDRYYGAASATPAAVFGTLLRKAQHHQAKMKGPYYTVQIQQILALLEPESAFPGTLSLEQQGLFALGYYHQRAELWKAKETAGPEAPQTDDDVAA